MRRLFASRLEKFETVDQLLAMKSLLENGLRKLKF